MLSQFFGSTPRVAWRANPYLGTWCVVAALQLSFMTPARAQTTPPETAPAAKVDAASDATTGQLEVATEPPGARVLLDGQELGMTPVRKEGLATGEHEIQVEQQGLQAFTRKVVIRQGETMRIDVTSPAPGMGSDPALLVTPRALARYPVVVA